MYLTFETVNIDGSSFFFVVWILCVLSGVGYAIDRVMKNCSIIPLQNNSFDASITNLTVAASKQQFILKMKSPQDLFYLDNNFTYTGRVRSYQNLLLKISTYPFFVNHGLREYIYFFEDLD